MFFGVYLVVFREPLGVRMRFRTLGSPGDTWERRPHPVSHPPIAFSLEIEVSIEKDRLERPDEAAWALKVDVAGPFGT